MKKNLVLSLLLASAVTPLLADEVDTTGTETREIIEGAIVDRAIDEEQRRSIEEEAMLPRDIEGDEASE